jgi:hypothetical protein
MNRWRVGEDRGSKETDGCPLTLGEGACGDVIEFCPLNVNEAASSTTVNEGLCASLHHGVC